MPQVDSLTRRLLRLARPRGGRAVAAAERPGVVKRRHPPRHAVPLRTTKGRTVAFDLGVPVSRWGDEVADRIADYQPRNGTGQEKAALVPLVRRLVTLSTPIKPSHAKARLTALWLYLLWRYRSGLVIDPTGDLFDQRNIDHFLLRHFTGTQATKATYQRALRDVAYGVHGPVQLGGPPAAIGERAPLPPYSAAETAELVARMHGASTRFQRENMEVLLGCGFGAGLSASDLRRLRVDDVWVDHAGVLVNVGGTRPRQVPVLRDWEPFLVNAKARVAPGELLFRPGRVPDAENFVSQFLRRFPGDPKLNIQRMRATWIVWHLASRTPVRALLTAAGVSHLDGDGIARYLRFVPDMGLTEARAYLREAPGSGP